MRLKGLVWFFAIVLILISIYQLSFTWVVNSHESAMKTKSERQVKISNPAAKGDEKEDLVKARFLRLLDSTKDTKIYPGLGTTYQKSKENELNLGLDLQGGMSVTMDVSLQGLIKSLSNNPKDPQLINALNEATRLKVNSDADYISLFRDAFKKQNPAANLASIFAGAGKNIKVTDSDDKVTGEIRAIAKGAINQTYKILLKRIDKFGVAQPNINLDENKGIITVELAGVQDAERVRKLLQSSANLQFWEVYNIGEIGKNIEEADKALQNYLNGVSPDTTKKVIDTSKNIKDTSKSILAKNDKPLINAVRFIGPQQDKSGKQMYSSAIASLELKDTAKANEYLNLEVVKNNFPANLKFLYGIEEKDAKSAKKYVSLYAIKTIQGSDKAKLEGDGVEEASQQYDERSRPSVKMQMTPSGSRTWAKLTTDNTNKPIAIVLDDVVYSAPNVNGPIEGGS
ncbi:MAG: protein translocase subunit SecDF, partial [Chitinophagaceae bacterium]|nr:protein translocase subunit SecDF [Chitinophagaceae bacterium]